jgi:hypothetical protein
MHNAEAYLLDDGIVDTLVLVAFALLRRVFGAWGQRRTRRWRHEARRGAPTIFWLYASMIARQIDRPMATPPVLVVWHASKMRSEFAGSMPDPESCTARRTPFESVLAVLISNRLGRSSTALIASAAFWGRFRMTC